MPQTPSQRSTRSNSNPNPNITFTEIKSLIEDAKSQLMGKISQEIGRLSEMLTTALQRIDDLDRKTKLIERNHQENHAKLEEQIKDLRKKSDRNYTEMLQEVEQRAYRSSNVIFFGLPESNEGTFEQRKNSDLVSVNDVLTKIDSVVEISSPMACQRLGKSSSTKPRPLRITGLTSTSKLNILRRSRSLRNSEEYKHVFINADLTLMQQREAKA